MTTLNPELSSSNAASPNWARRAVRITVALLLTSFAVLQVLRIDVAQAIEASILSWWLGPLLDGGVHVQDAYFTVKTNGQYIAFVVTPECSAVVIIAPLLIVSAFLFLSLRVRFHRALIGLLAMLGIIVVINQMRLAVIAYSTILWGLDPGYEISHRFVGSLIGIAGFIAGLIALLTGSGLSNRWWIKPSRSKSRPRHSAEDRREA